MEQTTDVWLLAGKLFPLLFNLMGPIGLVPGCFRGTGDRLGFRPDCRTANPAWSHAEMVPLR